MNIPERRGWRWAKKYSRLYLDIDRGTAEVGCMSPKGVNLVLWLRVSYRDSASPMRIPSRSRVGWPHQTSRIPGSWRLSFPRWIVGGCSPRVGRLQEEARSWSHWDQERILKLRGVRVHTECLLLFYLMTWCVEGRFPWVHLSGRVLGGFRNRLDYWFVASAEWSRVEKLI
jgi:hypothetical protein